MAEDADIERAAILVQRADVIWRAALERFDPYADRLMQLAVAAEQEAKALLHAEIADAPWTPIDVGEDLFLAEELLPGQRPSSDAAWKEFDDARRQLGLAMAGDGYSQLARAFRNLSGAAKRLALAFGYVTLDDEERQAG